jgi:hypothetical protein
MINVVDSVNKALQDHQAVETSTFYKDYQNFSKQYDSLIKEGVTQRRESQLKTIQEQATVTPFSYNTAGR